MSNFNYVVALRSIKMHPTTKLVAITLATYADYQTGECYPTVQTLMADTGLSNRVVSHHLKLIEAMEILVVDRSNGRRSYYKFIAENIAKAVTQSHQLRKVTSDYDDTKPVTFVQQPVTLMQKAVTQSHTNNHKQPIEQLEEQPNIYSQEITPVKPEPKPKKPKTQMTTLPTDFQVSERVKVWASEKGFDRLDEHLENFIGYATANAKKYADWDQAFMNAIRGNWAKLGNQVQARPQQYQSAVQTTITEQQKWDDFLNGSSHVRDVSPKKLKMIEGVGHA